MSTGRLTMHNDHNWEEFSTLILPGVKTISTSNMERVFEAWKSGMRVIFTTQLPCKKVVDGHGVYLFGNIDGTTRTTAISLRSAKGRWYLMDPHTGRTTPAALKRSSDGRHCITVTLEPSCSLFLISR